MPNMSGSHQGMHHSSMTSAGSFLMGQSSGTAFQPAAWPMPMLMTMAGDWHLLWMGHAHITAGQQSGPRGGDKFYSTNWGMLGAMRKAGRGTVMLRAMASLDPLTVTDRRYPLLFQTGETAFGRALVDAQHPHDLIMELSAQYAHPIGERSVVNLYYAPVGDAALGPVAFPHRASAMEIPQATLAHHWQDSTHIASNVLTAGASYGRLRVEASGFHGAEPDENRWNIDFGPMDSWSTRVSAFPNDNWMAQFSVGRLTRPEALHADDIWRTTASVHHIVPRPGNNFFATSFIWARNKKTLEERATHAIVAEMVVPVRRHNFISGRFEWSQRDELFENQPEIHERLDRETGAHAFPVRAYTIGFTRDLELFRNLQTGLGTNVTLYGIGSELKPFYGDHPWGLHIFLRVRLRPGD